MTINIQTLWDRAGFKPEVRETTVRPTIFSTRNPDLGSKLANMRTLIRLALPEKIRTPNDSQDHFRGPFDPAPSAEIFSGGLVEIHFAAGS